ncbi:multidrug efflux SMR transporter [Staphylococcus aureus]|uniref:DMT family transporter n=1 Tax=Staphylococcus haemolyticus TaxID=1283 RepID=UPI0029705B05|nr:multidrug efflux SMR transporter [Staphylococcus aureus]MDG6569339.1 multidrug efflux SMR transporter [Staphylococcus aureus]MDG6577409.1 multidrug efflux SMR transporter [Staphylococcus aureus]MDG6585361.1 multidrug efflux SMR transporter [Staphylococcus aureus]
MKAYFLLSISIIFEVFATTMLKMSDGFTILLPSIGVAVGYGLSFYFLGLTLKILPLSLAYAIWAGVGTLLTLLVSVVLWSEVLSILKITGLLLIVSGVVVLNTSKSNKTATELSN